MNDDHSCIRSQKPVAPCKLAAPSLDAMVKKPGPNGSRGFYSPEAFNVSGLRLSFVIFGFSMLQMM
jgi:hypothetical protein